MKYTDSDVQSCGLSGVISYPSVRLKLILVLDPIIPFFNPMLPPVYNSLYFEYRGIELRIKGLIDLFGDNIYNTSNGI